MKKRLSTQEMLLINAGEDFVKAISRKNDYQSNRKLLVAYFNEHILDFISCLSSNTLSYLKQVIDYKGKDKTLKPCFIFNEDFFYLQELGVLSFRSLRINACYKKIVRKAINFKQVEDVCYVNTLLKGVLDLYGYVDMFGLVPLLNQVLPFKVNKKVTYNLYKENRLINHKGHVTHKYIARMEVNEMKEDFLTLRNRFNYKYASYSIMEILNFASAFTFKDDFPFGQEENNALKISKFLSMILNPEDPMIYAISKDIDIETLKQINMHYPKWILKGHTIYEELYKDSLYFYGDNVENA